ncbi:hypothetical protein KAU08_10085, partial [bacterium]|nr:hypothetical protein [bacterium]
MRKNHSSLRDFIIVMLISALIVMVVVLPNFCHHPRISREAELKANCHTLQIALERYYVDNGEYPPYLLGGDPRSWENWHK